MFYVPSSSSPLNSIKLLAILLFVSEMSHAETWVITDRSVPLIGTTSVRLIYLDEQQRLEELLSAKLPENPHQATVTAQRYLATSAGKYLQRKLALAHQGLTDAWSLGVEKIPAVVVDRRYVIYGEPDVAKAVERINQARSASQ